MTTPIKDTNAMIAGMHPVLQPGEFAFVVWSENETWPEGTRASCVEAEGLSLIVPTAQAPQDAVAMRCITLQVHSSLEGVGLTAAVSDALAQAGIPANMVAGYHHDHVYVPSNLSKDALKILQALQRSSN
ncbi:MULTISPECIES: ACT domain-containing protein [unclassified Ruegeria]|uniref:ACT domain-containing protein n=1 Tax=unclassified Ruegeria TaxID=2625375 RepID=UPI0014889177|nr:MULTISPECIES: ACT domain-containing protein [unclassified Ruegeria]NOD33690.1 ACT domain-containing protein [Ruegeria sp. HKCCD7296]NOE40635.1 ACT domain-containing protein [Ruegeria sp. HKCCD7319]